MRNELGRQGEFHQQGADEDVGIQGSVFILLLI
jgi:hypothetical protein